MKKLLLTLCVAGLTVAVHAQGYTNWRTGAATDLHTAAAGGVCMMGGATEHDNAMRWFLQRAGGGDVLVLRASGSNGYNNYLYSELGVTLNSVETIRFDNATAASAAYVHQRINEAEAIWFAGGDQWNYVNYWRGTAIDSLVNKAIAERNIVIGGTSAGMAILGGAYFSAQYGTITSSGALANPYAMLVAVSNEPFLQVPWMADVVTDTHYDNPDRRGRHTVFMARAITDHGIEAKGIACNEYVAVTIDEHGGARVWGEWPAYQEYAYFLQANCLTPGTPEVCTQGVPLTWNHNGMAVKAYKVPGTMEGTNTFQLTDWRTGTGGAWEDWHAVQGAFITGATTEPMPECGLGVDETADPVGWLARQPDGAYRLHGLTGARAWSVHDAMGRHVPATVQRLHDGLRIEMPPHAQGVFVVRVVADQGPGAWKLLVE